MTKENRDKQMRLVGKLMAAEATLKEAKSDILAGDKRSRELLDLTLSAIEKALLSVWDQTDQQ